MSAATLAVWAAENRAGLLEQAANRSRYVFGYNPSAVSPDAG